MSKKQDCIAVLFLLKLTFKAVHDILSFQASGRFRRADALRLYWRILRVNSG